MAGRTKIQASSRLPQYRKHIHAASKKAVAAGARAGAEAARREIPVGEGKPVMGAGGRQIFPAGHLRDEVVTLPIGKMRKGGWRAAFGAGDPVLMWLDLGTFGAATRKRKTATAEIRRKFYRSAGRKAGIRPRRFMAKANKVALARSLVVLKREAGRRVKF